MEGVIPGIVRLKDDNRRLLDLPGDPAKMAAEGLLAAGQGQGQQDPVMLADQGPMNSSLKNSAPVTTPPQTKMPHLRILLFA